jgi:hypothetical protein
MSNFEVKKIIAPTGFSKRPIAAFEEVADVASPLIPRHYRNPINAPL